MHSVMLSVRADMHQRIEGADLSAKYQEQISWISTIHFQGCNLILHVLASQWPKALWQGRLMCRMLLQIRKKGSNENLAEWIVDISTEADRQGSDIFMDTYNR